MRAAPVLPTTNTSVVVDAMYRLRRLQREMTRLSRRDTEYKSNRQALQAVIQELRKVISRDSQ
jgi:hypothetical protein